MAYVKLDTGILNSTLWADRESREIFITALLMAVPRVLKEPMVALKVRGIEPLGFVVQPGYYGLVEAAGIGILRQSLTEDTESGMSALERLSEPDHESRSEEHEGRRMVRVNGGYIILNYGKYRDKDHTAAKRQKEYRQRKANTRNVIGVTCESHNVTSPVTQAEADISNTDPPPLTPPPDNVTRNAIPSSDDGGLVADAPTEDPNPKGKLSFLSSMLDRQYAVQHQMIDYKLTELEAFGMDPSLLTEFIRCWHARYGGNGRFPLGTLRNQLDTLLSVADHGHDVNWSLQKTIDGGYRYVIVPDAMKGKTDER